MKRLGLALRILATLLVGVPLLAFFALLVWPQPQSNVAVLPSLIAMAIGGGLLGYDYGRSRGPR